MKTGGTSLRGMLLESVLQPHELAPYMPDADEQARLVFHVINPYRFKDKIPRDLAPIRVIAAHYPFLAYQIHPPPLITFSLLRDPVDRAASHLRHIQRDDHPNRPFEELYEDKQIFDDYLYNLQARAFVFDESDDAPSLMNRTFDWDEERLKRAQENLESLDVLGLTREFPTFAHDLERAFGWKFKRVVHWHDAPREQAAVPDSLRKRMRNDLEYDVRFFEHATRVFEARQKAANRTVFDLSPDGGAAR